MISSPEEARLLLSKWINESSWVIGFATPGRSFIVRLEGLLECDPEEEAFFLRSDRETFIGFVLEDCTFGYLEGQEMPETFVAEMKVWPYSLFLTYPSGAHLLLCTKE